MSTNSVTGSFQDIEVSFSVADGHAFISVRNLIDAERQVRVMYQKLAVSGLANWKQFQLTNTPVSFRLPTEILEAYRLTFFVDKAEPISARLEKILAELDTLKAISPVGNSVEGLPPLPDISLSENRDVNKYTTLKSKVATAQQVEEIVVPRTPERIERNEQESEEKSVSMPATPEISAVQTVEPDVPEESILQPELPVAQESEQEAEEESAPMPTTPEIPTVQNIKPTVYNVNANLEFKIRVPSLPASALAERKKLQIAAMEEHASSGVRNTSSKRTEKGIFGQLVQVLGLSAGGIRGKAYYQEKGEAIQNEFQDQLAKLERDYNEGYGLNLADWGDPETLCEEETAVLLLNLMVNEVKDWQKEVGRATPEREEFVQTLNGIDARLRQTLKQTRGISTPSPTLFPDLLAESQRDLEKIQSECDAYLQRFTKKLIEQEKKHAVKIEVLIFKKFLIEFVRDFLFVEVAKSLPGNELPQRLTWFLDLVDSEVIPIEVGETKVSPNHHKVKGACISEFEPGTIVEVVTPGLQSKDGKRVSHMAVVIEAE
ncbi:MAG: hypothetical protein OYL97_16490 [Candidatus Poribacteria bacterium]|nr:hypothetical protein [Candidatus Poribacteria bacterium]